LVFVVVSKLQCIVPDFHLHHQRTPWSAINYVYLNVSDCVTHMAYTYGPG